MHDFFKKNQKTIIWVMIIAFLVTLLPSIFMIGQ